jgi:hypothetical protein
MGTVYIGGLLLPISACTIFSTGELRFVERFLLKVTWYLKVDTD